MPAMALSRMLSRGAIFTRGLITTTGLLVALKTNAGHTLIEDGGVKLLVHWGIYIMAKA